MSTAAAFRADVITELRRLTRCPGRVELATSARSACTEPRPRWSNDKTVGAGCGCDVFAGMPPLRLERRDRAELVVMSFMPSPTRPRDPGRWRTDEIADATGIALPERDDYDTISGLVMHQLGRIARPGDQVELTLHIPSPEGPSQQQFAVIEVTAVAHHVPSTVRLRTRPAHTEQGSRQRDGVAGR